MVSWPCRTIRGGNFETWMGVSGHFQSDSALIQPCCGDYRMGKIRQEYVGTMENQQASTEARSELDTAGLIDPATVFASEAPSDPGSEERSQELSIKNCAIEIRGAESCEFIGIEFYSGDSFE